MELFVNVYVLCELLDNDCEIFPIGVVEGKTELEMLLVRGTEPVGTDVELEDETMGTTWYMFKRDRPPQYSVELAAHTMLHPFTAGSLLVWLTEPALITLPQ